MPSVGDSGLNLDAGNSMTSTSNQGSVQRGASNSEFDDIFSFQWLGPLGHSDRITSQRDGLILIFIPAEFKS